MFRRREAVRRECCAENSILLAGRKKPLSRAIVVAQVMLRVALPCADLRPVNDLPGPNALASADRGTGSRGALFGVISV
jgi:hypothetical protein